MISRAIKNSDTGTKIQVKRNKEKYIYKYKLIQ